ncbi:hypothetical protein DLAC_01441 [Tieghemostelium lacteum]|uniref:Uncharacterized protein n=1 Tax=Tieghemostelium lacteum TaxID=361077 RepID=A0A152A5G0_TIELA|nr:hypothetical protein DLAC_01441 [Tieghemostelium lacteum]|eukprot:KYR01460.1 hypothetical protein DLAC_01441 [Tieghemostelium lacteum]
MVYIYYRWRDHLHKLHISIDNEWGFLYLIDPDTRVSISKNDCCLVMPIHLEKDTVSTWFDIYEMNRFTFQKKKINKENKSLVFEELLVTDTNYPGLFIDKELWHSNQTDTDYHVKSWDLFFSGNYIQNKFLFKIQF